MKIHLLSDMHLEHLHNPQPLLEALPLPEADVLILAGDIVGFLDGQKALDSLARLSSHYRNTIYVPGNHEYWGLSQEGALGMLERVRQIPNLHLLDNKDVVIEGQRFLGGTMWFPEHPMIFYGKTNDWKKILYLVPWVYEEAARFNNFMMQSKVTKDDIVVTHYLPSHMSVAAEYKGSPINYAFVHEQDRFILDRQPKLWVHGHTHFSCDYSIGDTQILCNPLGYPSEKSTGDPNFVFEV